MVIRPTFVALLLTAATVVSQADAAPINGGFETGDLSGWTSTGNVSVKGSSPYPDGGSYYAEVRSTPFGTPGRLSQSFSIGGPTTLSFLYYSNVVSGPASITMGLTNLDSISTVVFVDLTTLPGESVEDIFDPPDFVPSINHLIVEPGNYELFVLAAAPDGGAS